MEELLSSLLRETALPDIWLDYPDKFEIGKGKWEIKVVPLKNITDVAWTVTVDRKKMEEIFRLGEPKLPLIIVKKDKGVYELYDGQHRYAAYVNVFPNLTRIKVAVIH